MATGIAPHGLKTTPAPFVSDTSQVVRCTFCRGASCRSCSKDAYRSCPQNAFEGIHSNWINDQILAMQRPSSRAMRENDLVQKFKEVGIQAIFNCTMPGEHPLCGDGILEATGLSYDPEDFQRYGIAYYAFGWEDMTVPVISLMDNIVRIAAAMIYRSGKIAVHCHAGFGRTGLVIACTLILTQHMSADKAIQLVRARRPRSIQTRYQEAFVHEFEAHLHSMIAVYRSSNQITFEEALQNQLMFLHGEAAQRRRWITQPVYLCLETLKELSQARPEVVCKALIGTADGQDQWSPAHELCIAAYIEKANQQDWQDWEDLLSSCSTAKNSTLDARVPAQLLYDYLFQLREPLLPAETCVAEMAALLRSDPNVDLEAGVARLDFLQRCHRGISSTLQETLHLMRLLQAALTNPKHEDLLASVRLRVGLALTQLDKKLGRLVLNGRDLTAVVAPQNICKPAWIPEGIVNPIDLTAVVSELHLLDTFMRILMIGWNLVPRTTVGTISSAADEEAPSGSEVGAVKSMPSSRASFEEHNMLGMPLDSAILEGHYDVAASKLASVEEAAIRQPTGPADPANIGIQQHL